MLAVAQHYYHFDGRSPINDQNRALLGALREYFALRERIALPIYWGNRNWHPLLPDTVRQMRDDGVRHALAFVTSAFGSYSGCRQYIENIEQARAEVENAPRIDKIRPFSAHPKFLEAMTDRVGAGAGRAAAGTLGLHRSLRARGDGAVEPVCAGTGAGLRGSCRRAGPHGLEAGVSEPERAAHAALARTGHPRLFAREPKRYGDRTDRVSLRSYGGNLRSRRGGAPARRGAGDSHRAARAPWRRTRPCSR